tara:strand:- start:1992 stop:2906 length:915 start_codon:yes stop_codon:yes gene_type:complete
VLSEKGRKMQTKFICLLILSLVTGITLLACTNGEAADFSNTEQLQNRSDSSSSVVSSTESQPQGSSNAAKVAIGSGQTNTDVQSGSLLQSSSSQAGIWVTGKGSITLEPDLALVNIGVETEAKTVTEARRKSAIAMEAVVSAVKAKGLTDKDVQTTSFNIWPRYDYLERGRELIGYTVSNSSSIKVRNISDVGPIIDDVANAGGNATRINGISFTVENTQPFMDKLREDAVSDARSKANHFASLSGVSVGQLVFISEVSSSSPYPQGFDAMEGMMMRAAADPVTSISGGELELSLSVQLGFSIQ